MSKPAALELANGDFLLGTGDRVVNLGFVNIQVYSVAFYVEPCAARSVLAAFAERPLDDCLADPSFYPALVRGKCQKTLVLTFCRSVGRERLTSSFRASLLARVVEAHVGQANVMLDKLLPDNGVADNDVLKITCKFDGKTIEAEYRVADATSFQPMLSIESGGEGGVWESFQNIFFDLKTEIPAIKLGVVTRVPELLASDRADHTAASEEIAAKKSTRRGSARSLATAPRDENGWDVFAGRSDGDPGYHFGDLTRGFYSFCTDAPATRHDQDDEFLVGAPPAVGGDAEAAELRRLKAELEAVTLRLVEAERRAKQRKPALLLGVGLGASLCLAFASPCAPATLPPALAGCLVGCAAAAGAIGWRRPNK